MNGFIDIKSGDGACRARRHVARACQDHGRTIVLLGDARGYNADDAFVPLFVVDHDGTTFFQTFHLTHLVGGLFGHLAVEILTRFVVEIDVRGLF